MTKYCKRCDQTKDLAEFGSNRSSRDGYTFYCLPCCTAMSREWQAANPKKVRKMRRQYRAANRDKIRESRKRSIAKNPEKYRAYDREWSRKWRAANPELARRRSRLKGRKWYGSIRIGRV